MQVIIDHMNLDQIANSGQCFRWQKLNDNTYGIPAFGRYLEISQNDNVFTLSCDEDEWTKYWKSYFDVDTDTDYDEVEKFIMESNDGFLRTAYEYGSGIRILRQDLWEVIISFVISQNNNIPRIKKSIEKLCDEVDGKFPNCYEIFDMDLTDKGLGYRDKYLEDACKWWICEEGYVESRLRNVKEPKQHLLEIKGVGNKVADCICLFGLHNLKAFPIDTHIKKIIDREYNGKMPDWVENKYSGLFQQYLFYYELNNGCTPEEYFKNKFAD